MSHNRLLELMSLQLSGEASPQELQELDMLLSTDAVANARYKLLQQFWNQHDSTHPIAVEESLQKVLNQLDLPVAAPAPVVEMNNERTMRTWLPAWAKVAVAAAVIFVAGIIFWTRPLAEKNKPAPLMAAVEKQNAKGVKSTIELPDGSKIWLNADSKFSYPPQFNKATREVYLEGEAFFDIQKNPAKPFIIHLDKGTVRVLGTSFNIRAYRNELKVETSVATGKVAFIPKTKNGDVRDTIFLTPEKKLVYNYVSEELVTRNTSSKEDKAWTEGTLIFKSMLLEDIAVELERNFGKKIVFKNEEVKKFRLTGSFQGNTLEEILFYLSRTIEFTYEITNEAVLIGQ
jgi:transmembrane sensor